MQLRNCPGCMVQLTGKDDVKDNDDKNIADHQSGSDQQHSYGNVHNDDDNKEEDSTEHHHSATQHHHQDHPQSGERHGHQQKAGHPKDKPANPPGSVGLGGEWWLNSHGGQWWPNLSWNNPKGLAVACLTATVSVACLIGIITGVIRSWRCCRQHHERDVERQPLYGVQDASMFADGQ